MKINRCVIMTNKFKKYPKLQGVLFEMNIFVFFSKTLHICLQLKKNAILNLLFQASLDGAALDIFERMLKGPQLKNMSLV